MTQPQWQQVAQLGDVDPIEHGGFFVFIDKTGEYSPQAELWIERSDDGDSVWLSYRWDLDRCTFIDGVLSDNEFHPGVSTWFAESLESVARCCDCEFDELVAGLCSEDPIQRAGAYQVLIQYHSPDHFDSESLTLDREEIEARYEEFEASK